MSKKIDGIYVALRGDYRQLDSDLKEARRIVKDASVNMSDAMGGALAPDKLKRSLGTLVTDLSQLQRSSKVTAADFKNIGFAASDLGTRLGLPEKQLEALQSRMLNHQAAEAQAQALKRIGTQAGLTAVEIRALGQQMGVSSAGIKSAGGGSMFGNMATGALAFLGPAGLALATIYAVARAAKETASAVYESGSKMERLTMSLTAITGSKAAAGETLSYLRAEADKAGVVFLDTADAYKSLLAAGNATGMAEKDIRDLFSAIVEGGAVVGMTSEQQTRSLTALTQMMSKGTVSSEELKQQLGESLPGAFAIAAKSMGVTTQELSKMLEKGEVISKDFLPKFAKAMKDEFGGSIEDAGNTGTAAVNKLDSAWTQMKANFYDSGTVVASVNMITAALNAMGGAAPKIAGGGTIDSLREQRGLLVERLEGIRSLGDAHPKVEALRKELAALDREITNAQVALGKNTPDLSRPKTSKQQFQDAADAAKLMTEQSEKQLEAAKKLQAVTWDIKIAREAGGLAGVDEIAILQAQKQHSQTILDLQRELVKAKTDATIDSATINASIGLENQRHSLVIENIRKEAQTRDDAFLSKLGAEKDARQQAYQQALYDAENEKKLAGMAEARTVGGQNIEDQKAALRELYAEAAYYTNDRAALEEQLTHKLAALDIQKLESSRKASDGMRGALLKYSQEAGNDGANMFQLWTTSIKATEDALVEMGMKSEITVTSLFNTIRAEALRTQVVRPLMSGLAGLDFSGMFSGIFHDGGIVGETSAPMRSVSPALFAGAPRFHDGLMPDEFPAILQRGEAVIPRDQVGRMGGVSGGVQVVIQNYTGAPVKTQESTGPGGQRQLLVMVGDMVKSAIASGQLDRTMQQNYGIRRQGV